MTMDRVSIRNNTAKFRLPGQLENGINNLTTVNHKSSATEMGRWLAGKMAVIVSAGPSLDKTLGKLEALKDDVVIVCVNTARPALKRAGIEPDLVVTMEALDVDSHLEDGDIVFCAITSHPKVWARAQAVYFDTTPWWISVAHSLDLTPIHAGGSCSNAAFALCVEWGASAIAFLGQDLAYDLESGRAYASGTFLDEMRIAKDGDGYQLTKDDARNELHVSNNVPKMPSRPEMFELPAWGDPESKVYSPPELVSQHDWFGKAMKRMPPGAVFNCTEGGAHVPGAKDMPLDDAWGAFNRAYSQPVRGHGLIGAMTRSRIAADVGDAFREFKRQADIAMELAESFLSGDVANELYQAPLSNIPFAEAMCTPDLIGAQEVLQGKPPHVRMNITYNIWKLAANRIHQACDAWDALQKEAQSGSDS